MGPGFGVCGAGVGVILSPAMHPKKLLVSVLLLLASALVVRAEYPAQRVNRVDSVHFGQSVGEIELILEKKALPARSSVSRRDKDFEINEGGVRLEFDSGFLRGIKFDADFSFEPPIAPYRDSWQNLDPIGGLRIRKSMGKAQFLKYLEAWEARAIKAGARRCDRDEVLKAGEYSVDGSGEDSFDMIHIAFGPQRLTGKGGKWGSGIFISFVAASEAALYGRSAGTLDSISVSCDEFNTRSRHH